MRRNSQLFLLVMAVVAFGLTTASVEAFARAGGGGGRGGTIHLILLLILLPLVAIYSAIVSHIVNKKHRQCRELLQRLEQTDASWALESIERRVEQMYFKVQEAWMQRDQSIAREFMSDRLHEKHKMQTDLMRSEHRKNVLDKINLTHTKVVNVSHYGDDSRDCLWVYIQGDMIDYIVNDQTGRRISGHASRPEWFAELWKLVRGKTGWVLDEIQHSASIFDLSHLHPSIQETGFVRQSPDAIP
jgi:inner membrane protein import complex subunit Tim44-like protein